MFSKENNINKTTCLKHTMYPFQINNLEDNTDHFDLENKISHELLHVEVVHLQ